MLMLVMCIFPAGGALFLQASSALFGGGASFSGNQAVPEGKGLGGAVCAESNSSITFGAKTSFLHNKAWSGGAVKIGGYSEAPVGVRPAPAAQAPVASSDISKLEFVAGSRSCWMSNSAQQAVGGGAIHISSSSSVDLPLTGSSLKQQQDFGSNKAGTVGQTAENDIQVAGAARLTCGGERARHVGSYVITGDVCAAGCTGRVCRCSAGQVFTASKCSCQPKRL